MTSISTWKKVLVILLFGILVTSLTFALVYVPNDAAMAETTLVLPENTAEYTITDVENFKTQIYTGEKTHIGGDIQADYYVNWQYDEDVNIWSVKNPYSINNLKLTANVTKGGVVAFEYLIDFDRSLLSLANVGLEKELLKSKFTFTVTPKEPTEERVGVTYDGTVGQFENHEFETISFDVQEGDTITFAINQEVALWSDVQGANRVTEFNGYLNWYLHGLGDVSDEVKGELQSNTATSQTNMTATAMTAAAFDGEITTSGTTWWDTTHEADGIYYVFPETYSGGIADTDAQMSAINKYTSKLSFNVDGIQKITFDTWYWALRVGTSQSTWVDNCSNYSIKIDGSVVFSQDNFTEQKEKGDKQYSIFGTKYPAEKDRQWTSHTFTTSSDGQHQIEIEFQSAKDHDISVFEVQMFFAFGVRNISTEKVETKTVQFSSYDDSMGKISYTVSGKTEEIPAKEGANVQIPKDATVKVSAEPKAFASFSEIPYVAVRSKFCVNEEICDSNTYTFNVDGDKTINIGFKQEAPKPLVWSQIFYQEEDSDANIVSPGRAIIIPNSGDPTLRLFFVDYAELSGSYVMKINGQEQQLQDVSNFDQIQLPEALQGEKVLCWARNDLQDLREIEVSYSADGYTAHSILLHVEFSAADQLGKIEQQTGDSINIYNNLFTSESENGLYFSGADSGNNIKTDTSIWRPFSTTDNGFSVEANSLYYGFDRASEGAGCWRNTILTLQLQEDVSGLLTFEIYLSGMADTRGVHAGAILESNMRKANNGGDSHPAVAYLNPNNYDIKTTNATGNFNAESKTFSSYDSFVRLLAPKIGGGAEEYPSRFEPEKNIAKITALEDGWFKVTVPTKATVSSYDVSGNVHNNETGEANFSRFTFILTVEAGYEASMGLRNFTFINASDVEITTKTSQDDVGSVLVKGVDDNKKAAFGSTVTFTANVPQGKKLYGWSVETKTGSAFYPVDGDDLNYEYFATQSATVTAWIAEKNFYKVYLGATLYSDLNDALIKASNGTEKTVVALDSFTQDGDIIIPSGVTLLLPYSREGQFFKVGGKTNRIAWFADEANYKYITVTFNGKVTVNGSINVGGMFGYTGQSYHGHTSGAYSELIINDKLTIASGGVVNVYGRVTTTSNGNIEVNNGGYLYQPFLILDFAGGGNTFGLFMDNQTPFKRYAMINIECPITVHHGAQLIGHAELYAMGMFLSLDQPFISYDMGGNKGGDGKGHDTFVMLSSDASVTITYKYDKDHIVENSVENCTEGIGLTTMSFVGGAKFSYMLFAAMGAEVPTNGVDFAIPYNYEIELTNGKYSTETKFKLMPGSKVHICNGAEVTLNEDFYVLDGLVQTDMSGKSYPSAEMLKQAGYSTNAQFIVDGKLNIKKHIFLGVIQTTGSTGEIVVDPDAILTGTIIDGALGGYDCNYSTYPSSARIWGTIAGVGTVAALQKGKTYTAIDGSSWQLPQFEIQYCDKAFEKHSDKDDHTLSKEQIDAVDMVGSWKVEHGDSHLLDWTYNAEKDTLPNADTHHTTITRQCTELGCDHSETRELLYAPASWGDITYTGDNLTDDELKAAINKLFGSGYDLFATAGGSLSHGTILEVNGTGYDVTVTLAKGFWVSGENYSTDKLDKQLKINVTAAQLTAANVDKIANVTYNGKEQKPQIKVTYNGRELTLDTHYNVDYRDNTNVGQATITVTAADKNYAGEFEVHFTIDPLDITSAQLQGIEDSYEYSGKPQKPEEFDVIATGNLTVPKGDYDVSYSHDGGDDACTKLGKVTVTVTMKEDKNFTGSASKTFDITAANADNAQVTVNGEYTYSGSAQTPDSDNVQVTLAGFDTLVYEQDYTFAATSNTNAGMATVTVTFTGNFTGSATGTFQIKQKDISVLTFGGVDASYVYTGKAIKPEPTVQFNEIPLVKEQDFTVTYNSDSDGEACIAVGTVTVTVTAKDGNYTGSKTLTYGITVKDAAEAQIQVTGSYVYNSQTQTAALTVTLDNYTITENDYTVDYGASDRVNVGTVNFTVNFTGNFSGSKQLSFQITQAKVVVKPQAAQSPEGEDQVALNYDVEGTMYNQDEATLRGGITLKLDGELSAKHAGDTLKIVVVLDQAVKGKLSNYDIDVSQTADYTVTEAVFGEVTVSADVNVPYDGKEHPITVSGQPEHAVTEIKYTLKGEPFEGDPKDVGDYSVTVRITLASYHEYSVTRTVTIRAAQLTVQINKQTTTFSGKQQRPDSAATNWKVLGVAQGESVTLTLEASLTDVGKTDIVATLVEGDNTKLSNYTYDKASLTLKDGFEVTAKSVDDLTFGGVNASYEYTGNAIHPQPTVKFGEISLEQEQDFTVAYGGNTTVVGGGTVTVNGRGNYTGSKQLTFTITAKDASGAQVTVTNPQSYVYNGTNQTVKLTVTLANYAITASDYTVEYADGADRTNVGTVNFTVNFTGNFSGKVDKLTFTVTAKNATLNIEEQRVTFDRNPHDAAQLRHSFADVLPGDEQDITVTLKGSGTNVGNYNVTAEFGGDKAGNYNFTVNGDGKLVIEAATIDSVRVTSTHIYNGTEQTPALEVKAGSLTLQQGEYTVGYRGNRSDVGTVTVTVQANGGNFVGNAQTQFSIDKATITVTVDDKSSVYGEPFDDNFTFEASGICDKDKESLFVKDYITLSCDASVSKVVNTYDITAKVGDVQPDNYNIVIGKQGTYTVTARDVTVNVFDQNDVYNRDHDYDFVSTKWQLAQDSTMAYNQDPSVLQVVLAKPTMTDAGSYKIVPSYTNPNYNVTFVGSWQGSDEHQGKAGTYTVDKLTLIDGENDAWFVLQVNGRDFNEQHPELYKYAGEAYDLTAIVYVGEDEVTATVDPSTLDRIGIHQVTVTIQDTNYQGSKTYNVELVGDDGYSQNLHEVLQALNELVGNVTADTLGSSDEHFAIVKGIESELSKLNADEKELGADELVKYQAIVDAWNNAAAIDDSVIETAKALADAPINWLFAISALNVLLSALYVVGKGGQL